MRAFSRRLGHLGVVRAVAAIAHVVGDGIVEQHRVLRHHADGGAQRSLRHLADILSVDRDAAAARLVETEQQPRYRRLSGARGADDGDGRTRRRLERNALAESAAPRHRRTRHSRSAPRRAVTMRSRAPGKSLISGFWLKNVEHRTDVDDRLLDLAIDHAHEVERLIELQHHHVEQREIADRVAPGADAGDAHQQHRDHADREDHRLARVQHRQRDIGAHAEPLVARHRLVVARRLAVLGAEIFDGLEVEQRVDRLGVGVGVALVHRAADRDAPVGRHRRERRDRPRSSRPDAAT